jgi:N-acylneuraminate cytidylyltransferase
VVLSAPGAGLRAHRVVGLVPLRGGSKSIPGKNIRDLAGKPMCAWVLEEALQASCIEELFVSTDSREVADTVRGIDSRVRVLSRPSELAQDSSSTESVMLHFAALVPFDDLITIQATSPLTRAAHLDAAYAHFLASGADSLLTGVRTRRFFWTADGRPLNYDPRHRPRRQDWGGVLTESGAFYITRREVLEREGCRLGGRIAVYEMGEEHAVELDEPGDWTALERVLRARRTVPHRARGKPRHGRGDPLSAVLVDRKTAVRRP